MNKENIRQAMNVVLVDDEPRIQEVITDILQNAGLARHIEKFDDPLSFLEFFKSEKRDIDLILLDVHFENSGLSGIDILPFIREDAPYLPVVLLTGMESEEIEDAQDYECTYYIPKPVRADSLVRMIHFYLGRARKSGRRISELSQDLHEHKELLEVLEKELAEAARQHPASEKEIKLQDTSKTFDRIMEIFTTVLKNCDVMPSFKQDLKKIFGSDFKIFKKYMDAVIQFDIEDQSRPGMKIHKYYGINNVYSVRLSKKVRLFYYQAPQGNKRRLLRLDQGHDTKGMDKWLKANLDGYKI